MSMYVDFRSLLQASLKRRCGRQHALSHVERVLWDPSIRHAVNISQPVESALGVEVLDSSLGDDLGVCHAVRPLDAKDVPQISQMECVQSLFLSGVRSPRLAAIEEGAADALYTATLIWSACRFPQTLLSKLEKVEAASPICLLVSVSRGDRVTVIGPDL